MRDPGRGPPFRGSHHLVWLLICMLLGGFLIASYETLKFAVCGLFSTVSTVVFLSGPFLSRHPGMANTAGASLSTSVGQQALQVLYASATGCSKLLAWGLMPICLICAPHIMLCLLAECISLLFRSRSVGGEGGATCKPRQWANSLIHSIADLYFNPRFTDLVLYISKLTASFVFLISKSTASLVLLVFRSVLSTIAAVFLPTLECFSQANNALTLLDDHNISNFLLSLYNEAVCVPRARLTPGIQACNSHPTLELKFPCNNFDTIWSTLYNVLSATSISELLSLNLNTLTTTRNPGLAYFYHLTMRILPVRAPASSPLPEILVRSLTMIISVYLTMIILAYLIRRIHSRASIPASLAHEPETTAAPVVTGAPAQPDNTCLDEDDVSDDDEDVHAGMTFPPSPNSSNGKGNYWYEQSLKPLRPPHGLVGGAADSNHSPSSNYYQALNSASASDNPTSSPQYQVDSKALQRLEKMKNHKIGDFRDKDAVSKRDSDVLGMVATALNQREDAKKAQAKTKTTLPTDDRNLDATTKNLQQLDNVLTIVFTLHHTVALSSLLTVLRNNKIIVLPSGNPQIRTGRGDAVCDFQQHILYVENSGSGHGILAKLLLGRLNLTVEGQPLYAHIYGGEKLTKDGVMREMRLSFTNSTTSPQFNNAPLDKVSLLDAPDAKSTLLMSLCALGVSLPLIHEIILACIRGAGIHADFIRMDTMRNETNPRTGRKTLWMNNDLWDPRCGIVLQFLSEADYNRAMALLSNSAADITFLPGMACLAEGNDKSLGFYPPSTIKVKAFEPSNRARGHARSPAQAQLPNGNNITVTDTLWIYFTLESLSSTDNELVSAEMTSIYTKILFYISVVLRFPSSDASHKRSFQKEVSNFAPRVAAALNGLNCGTVLDIFLSSQQDSQSGPLSSPVLTGIRVTVDSNSNALKMVDSINKGGLSTILELARNMSQTEHNPDESITNFLREGPGKVKVCAQLLVDCPPYTTATAPPLPRGLARTPPSQTGNTGRKQKPTHKSFAEATRGNLAPAARSASNPAQAARKNQAAEAPPASTTDAARRSGGHAPVAPFPVFHPPSVPSSAPHPPPPQPLTPAQIREMVSDQVKSALEASASGGARAAGSSEPFIRKLVAESVERTVQKAMEVLQSNLGKEMEQVKEDIDGIHIKLNQSSSELSAMQLTISGETQESIRSLSNRMDSQLTAILERLPLPTRSRAQSQPPSNGTGSRAGVAIFSRHASPVANDASPSNQE